MASLPRLKLGVPVKQTVEGHDGEVNDNFYVVKLRFFSSEDKSGFKDYIHLFTIKEITEAIERYYLDADKYVDSQTRSVIGHAYPLTYKNLNGVLITKVFCRLNVVHVSEFSNKDSCCLFSPREVIRSRRRYEDNLFINRYNIFKRLWKGLKKCLRK